MLQGWWDVLMRRDLGGISALARTLLEIMAPPSGEEELWLPEHGTEGEVSCLDERILILGCLIQRLLVGKIV